MIWDIAVSWSRDGVVVASYQGIHVWSLNRQEELFWISIEWKAIVRSVALSEDIKLLSQAMKTVLFGVGTHNLVSLSGSICQVIRKQ